MANQLDLVFKKIVNRQYTSAVKKWYEESPGVPFKLKGSDVWIDNIPETPPPVDSAVIKGFRSGNKLLLTKNTTVNNNQAWYAEQTGVKLQNFVSPRYGQGYTARLFIAGGAEIPTTHSCGWFFDYESGNLTFDATPPGSSFELMVYQYIGSTADDLAEALEGSAWQDPVLSIADAPAGGEVGKERYLISQTPTVGSVFEGHPEEIAEFDGVNWKFSAATQGKITYVISLDRLYVYDNNSGWAWSGIDSADLDYDNADSDLNALSVKHALDELDALLKASTLVIWVDSNRNDSYVPTGAIQKPYKSIPDAIAASSIGNTIKLVAGVYSGADVSMLDNVSLLGESLSNTFVQHNIVFGTDTTSLINVKNINFNGQNSLTFNNSIDVVSIVSNGNIIINGQNNVGYDVDINSNNDQDALLVNGDSTFDILTVNQQSDKFSLNHTSGKLRLNTTKIIGNRNDDASQSIGGTIETVFTSFINNGTGQALNINNGATSGDPNKLYDTYHKGDINCNDTITIVEGVTGGNPISSVVDNLNLIYRGGTQLKNESEIIKDVAGGILIGKTINDSVDRVAQVIQYDSTHGFMIVEPCIDDIV